MLELVGLVRHFRGIRAVDGVDLALEEGLSLGLIGPNGAGKSTLVGLLAGLLTPDAGVIRLAGRDLTSLPPEKRFHRGIAWSFQHARHFASLTVRQHLDLVLSNRASGTGSTILGRRKAADQWLADLGLDKEGGRPVSDLSMAHRKLLDFARAACTRPALLLLDEPLAGLSSAQAERIERSVRRLREQGSTLLIIEHRIRELLPMVDELAVLSRGVIIHRGTPRATLAAPEVVHAYFALGAGNSAGNANG